MTFYYLERALALLIFTLLFLIPFLAGYLCGKWRSAAKGINQGHQPEAPARRIDQEYRPVGSTRGIK